MVKADPIPLEDELKELRAMIEAMERLDERAQQRSLRFLIDRYMVNRGRG
jgi:hypothetical protein